VRSASGELLRDEQAVLQGWKVWYDTLLNATSPTLGPCINKIEHIPEHTLLAAEPSMEEVKEAVGKLENGKLVGADNLCGELVKLG
ncbi:unnamed protein product, partial [Sphacelaria rigidula]